MTGRRLFATIGAGLADGRATAIRCAGILLTMLSLLILMQASAICDQSLPQKTTLQNGLVLISKQNASSEIIAVDVFVRAGARYDPRGKSGLSSLVSRLLLNSFSNATGKEALAALNDSGGSIEVLSQQDYTEIYFVTTAGQMEQGLRWIVDLLQNTSFEEDKVAAEKQNLLAEIKTGEDDWFQTGYGALMDRLYRVSPYRRPVSGIPSEISKLSLADANAFYNAYFVPNNIVISVVGNVEHARLVKTLNRLQVDYMPRVVPRIASPVDEKVAQSESVLVQKDGNLAYILVGFMGPGMRSSDYPAAIVLDSMVGGGKASKLFQAFRESEGVGYELGSVLPPLQLQSHFVGYVVTDPYRINFKKMSAELALDEAKNRIVQQYTLIRDGKFTDDELRRAKRYAEGSYALRHQRMKEQAFFLGWYEAMGLGYEFDTRLSEKIEAVTREDIMRVANQYLGNYVVAALAPTR